MQNYDTGGLVSANSGYFDRAGNFITNGNWGSYYPYGSYEPPRVYRTSNTSAPETIQIMIGDSVAQQEQKEQQPMRALFEVYIVDPASETVRAKYEVVAGDAPRAERKAERLAVRDLRIKTTEDPDDFDYFVKQLGVLRAKKDVSEVRVVK